MRLIATAFTAAALVAASVPAVPAVAAERISDAAYLQAARCQGLAQATQLGSMDTTGIDAFMKRQARMREQMVRERAETVTKNARRAARAEDARTRLIAERDRVCASYGVTTQVAAGGGSGGASGAQ